MRHFLCMDKSETNSVDSAIKQTVCAFQSNKTRCGVLVYKTINPQKLIALHMRPMVDIYICVCEHFKFRCASQW